MKPHNSTGIERRFIISLILTGLILVGEIVGGIWTGSLALLSDAAHVFMDIFALALSFLALRLSSRPADDRHTYGWHRLEVLAALINGVSLVIIALGICREAYLRWQQPSAVLGLEMLIIAAIGLVVNIVVAFILGGQEVDHAGHDHHHTPKGRAVDHDINLQGAFLHVIGDAVSSLGVIIAGLVIWLTGWYWVDPIASALIGLLILFNALRLTRSAIHILLEGTPSGLSLQNVTNEIVAIPGVAGVHDLHVWSICSGHIALSAHIVLEDQNQTPNDVLMVNIKRPLQNLFGIEHTTIQFEASPCLEQFDCSGC